MKIFLTTLFAILLTFQANASEYDARYIRTLDADTHEFEITVWPQLTVTTKLRLNGIDTPETTWRASRECRAIENKHGNLAKDYTIGILEKAIFVKVTNVELGKFAGRVLGNVKLSNGRFLKDELLSREYAVKYNGEEKPNWCGILND